MPVRSSTCKPGKPAKLLDAVVADIGKTQPQALESGHLADVRQHLVVDPRAGKSNSFRSRSARQAARPRPSTSVPGQPENLELAQPREFGEPGIGDGVWLRLSCFSPGQMLQGGESEIADLRDLQIQVLADAVRLDRYDNCASLTAVEERSTVCNRSPREYRRAAHGFDPGGYRMIRLDRRLGGARALRRIDRGADELDFHIRYSRPRSASIPLAVTRL